MRRSGSQDRKRRSQAVSMSRAFSRLVRYRVILRAVFPVWRPSWKAGLSGRSRSFIIKSADSRSLRTLILGAGKFVGYGGRMCYTSGSFFPKYMTNSNEAVDLRDSDAHCVLIGSPEPGILLSDIVETYQRATGTLEQQAERIEVLEQQVAFLQAELETLKSAFDYRKVSEQYFGM